MERFMNKVTQDGIDCYVADKVFFTVGDLKLRELGYTRKLVVSDFDIITRERFIDSKNCHEISFDLSEMTVDLDCVGPVSRELFQAINMKIKEYGWSDELTLL